MLASVGKGLRWLGGSVGSRWMYLRVAYWLLANCDKDLWWVTGRIGKWWLRIVKRVLANDGRGLACGG